MPRVAGSATQAGRLVAEPALARKRLSVAGRAPRGSLSSGPVNPLEALATAAGLANIVLLVRRSIWNYPFGLVMVALYAWIFGHAKLYSDAVLQCFFFAIQLYGWWAWAQAGDQAEPVPVRRLAWGPRFAWCVLIAILSAFWGRGMAAYTDASYPWWDAAVAVASIAAQILLARRLIENWVIWILVDLAAIGLYAAKALYLTAGLYVIFLLLSIFGLMEWRRAMQR